MRNQWPQHTRLFARFQGLIVVFAVLMPAAGATFQLGVGLNQIEKMKNASAAATEAAAADSPKIVIELAGKYVIDPDTADPGLRLRRVRTMQR